MLEMLSRFSQGGSYMWVILVVGAWTAAIVIDRVIAVYWRANVNARLVMSQIERLLQSGDWSGAIQFCDGMGSKPLARVLGSALRHVDEGAERISAAMDEAMLAALPPLQKRTPYIFTMANIATLLGLMGTVQGLVTSFSGLDVNDPASQARILGQGISTALLTTAFGLIVAVPAILAHTLIQSKTEHLMEDIDYSSTRLLNYLQKHKK